MHLIDDCGLPRDTTAMAVLAQGLGGKALELLQTVFGVTADGSEGTVVPSFQRALGGV